MPAKGASTLTNPIRLPPLRALRVKRPNKTRDDPCAGILSSMLNCWASSGHVAQNCVMLEQGLRACMDTKRPKDQGKNNINYFLSKYYPRIRGQAKAPK